MQIHGREATGRSSLATTVPDTPHKAYEGIAYEVRDYLMLHRFSYRHPQGLKDQPLVFAINLT